MENQIFMLHGFMGTGDLHFNNQKEFFKDYMNVIVPDLPGHGSSDVVAASNYFDSTVEWLVKELEHKGPAYLMGLSLGASLAIHTAIKKPELVRGIILTGYSPFIPKYLQEIMEEQYSYFSNIEKNDRDTASYFESVHGEKWLDTLKKVNYIMTYEYPAVSEEQLKKINIPSLVINGSNELYEIEGASYIKSKNSDFDIGIIPGAGHTANIDKPDIYNNIVLDFLNVRNIVSNK